MPESRTPAAAATRRRARRTPRPRAQGRPRRRPPRAWTAAWTSSPSCLSGNRAGACLSPALLSRPGHKTCPGSHLFRHSQPRSTPRSASQTRSRCRPSGDSVYDRGSEGSHEAVHFHSSAGSRWSRDSGTVLHGHQPGSREVGGYRVSSVRHNVSTIACVPAEAIKLRRLR